MPQSLSTRNFNRNTLSLTDKDGDDFIKKAIKAIQDC